MPDSREVPPVEGSQRFTEGQIERAASELASQERYNPNWCHPGLGVRVGRVEDDIALYRRRARLIINAALGGSQAKVSE